LEEEKKIGLWQRTKEVAVTYTGTFIVVMLLNQLLFFGFCLNPICIIAAMPHVLLITVAVGTLLNKIGKWGDRGLLKKGAAAAGAKLDNIGDALDGAAREFKEEAKRARGDHASERAERERQALESLRVLQDLAKEIGLSEEDIAKVKAASAPGKNANSLEEEKPEPGANSHPPVPSATEPPAFQSEQNETSQSLKLASVHNDVSKSQVHGHHRVYITRNRLSNIAYTMSRGRQKGASSRDLYKADLSPLFSQPELGLLSVYKEMCANPEEAFRSYKKISGTPQKKNLVFQDGSPAYHADKDCELLHNDYYNLEMPVEIKSRGEAEIERFKAFCRDNRDLIKDEDPIVLKKLEAQFFLKNPPSKISARNSGVSRFDNMDLAMLESEIDALIFDAEKFRNKDRATFNAIRDRGYGTYKSDEARDPNSPLFVWHNSYKLPIKDLLMHYFRVKFNPDLAFEGFLLDQLGFKPCGRCGE